MFDVFILLTVFRLDFLIFFFYRLFKIVDSLHVSRFRPINRVQDGLFFLHYDRPFNVVDCDLSAVSFCSQSWGRTSWNSPKMSLHRSGGMPY